MRRFAEFTPFPYLIYMPAQILIGGEVDLAKGVAVSLAWGAVFFVIYRVLWACGLRRYSAMGA